MGLKGPVFMSDGILFNRVRTTKYFHPFLFDELVMHIISEMHVGGVRCTESTENGTTLCDYCQDLF